MITAILIDDETDALECLKWELENFKEEIRVISIFDTASDAILFLEENEVDAVFLDVEMPEMSGFEFLENFAKRDFAVIITTAYQDYALPAIKKQCLDFLQKPTDSLAIRQCIEKIKNFKNEHLFITYFEEKLYRKAEKEGHKKIIINTDGKLMFLQPEDIIYCESDGNYSTIYLENGKKILISTPLKQVEEKLTDDFFRIHHSYIINMNKVTEYMKNDSQVMLCNNIKIPVSRQKKTSFLDHF
ncbi:LytR/AlgR family response regulator transcription factor [Chryseobacterium koreense]|uniref:LytTR family transcriptional regulator n=1 Tax=Chryseobacterium koreense CCUG 49689 TaxID=1304281 RepID=A0A0J7J457_9FLAO|nr:LytTR family DNA-binding domain-containing protein [Chryseobacterium koreense]KMQ72711.1 LytTR family transcriptional regulator [Chryseobacterium koreense CCUG 49689]MBB5333116.1 two-component system LytT family response regulator [Chryseobacterium koreense]